MPAPSGRRIATSALCAAFLLGVAAPTALADDAARDRARQAAPAPDAATLQRQVQQVGHIGAVVPPVTALVDAVLKADNGRLSATEAARLGNSAKSAIAMVAAAAVTPATPGTTPPATTLPAVPTTPTTSTNPAAVPPLLTGSTVGEGARELADAVDDALDALQTAVDALVAAATSGDLAGALAAATDVATKLAGVVAALLGGSGLPLPVYQPS
ncbi:hypothetical protein [Streptomyces sp. TRM68367]|uniref:hypothetical protein n=1 Tax=Streptomyces sp. TRM68367 TaxID=2758415 RepID=UPI00165B0E38|nr:hypothetical protein [Streptomyces sp. TRM68367]MBC9725138.1 hypothetical protein [Streptomyces sp. TRM68367]